MKLTKKPKEDIGTDLVYREYVMREEFVYHAPFNPEMEFYDLVKAGNIKKVEKIPEGRFLFQEGIGGTVQEQSPEL